MTDFEGCTTACEAMPECTVCHRSKKPIGRDAPVAAANGYCDFECDGFAIGEQPGHLWPGELARARNEWDDE